ncbi:hypothetical protein QYF36_006445 [Acer negundo]|nr:hypothetical protein QYF36_004650 [Acer negundo]KAK4837555.1 hypothetical protein QYF36_006445 [Acer negundo]
MALHGRGSFQRETSDSGRSGSLGESRLAIYHTPGHQKEISYLNLNAFPISVLPTHPRSVRSAQDPSRAILGDPQPTSSPSTPPASPYRPYLGSYLALQPLGERLQAALSLSSTLMRIGVLKAFASVFD